ncbi:MAG: thiolase family protein [Chloroflexi bacterium]|nr:thiolase family protein [Chloroflexota bacterium]
MARSKLSRRFAIVGIGVTKVGRVPGHTARAFQTEAARLAIEDAGLKRTDIDGAINAKLEAGGGTAGDWVDAFPRILGLPVKFYFHIGRGGAPGSYALMAAGSFLEQGIANYVLVSYGGDAWSAGHVKKEEATRPRPGTWGNPFGDVRAMSHHSFFACRHMYEFGTTSRQFGAIAVAERAWACKNPEATMYGRPITIEDHQNSPFLAWPYHLLDISLESDGGSAYIVTTAERARDCKKPPVYVLGQGFGEHIREKWWKKTNYTALDVEPAREKAFKTAGIELKDVDVAELYDCFTGEVMLQLEGYGWCKKGEGGPFVETGAIGPGGSIPVNTGGGLLSSHHHQDLTPILEGVRQIRGEAGERQIKGARIALVTGHGGELLPGMSSTHCCTILGK